jgi:Fe-S cluster biogenesis protein NfuA
MSAHQDNNKNTAFENIQISVETTPNPATLKFSISQKMSETSDDFANSAEAFRSPLAAKLFGFPWTERVYIGTDFVTVTKQDWVDWEILAEPLMGLIKEHIESGEPVISAAPEALSSHGYSDSDTPIIRQIKQILNNEIRPAVALDGGDIEFVDYKNQILSLQMKGSCVGCPSSSATLKQGIEVRMKELLPEIKEVIAV